MILGQREAVTDCNDFKDINKNNLENDRFDEFGTAMPDGRLCEPSDGREIRLHDAIKKLKELGRPLTKEEMEEFYV